MPSTRVLALIGVILLGVALLIGLRSMWRGPRETTTARLMGAPAAPGRPAAGGSGTQGETAPTPPLLAVIEAEWPAEMEVGQADTIRVTLVRAAGDYRAAAEVSGNLTTLATPVAFGTPGVPLDRQFGPQYEAAGEATLAAIAFDAQPLERGQQLLDQPRVTWEWNVLPKNVGEQVINVSVEAHWKPKAGGAEIQRQIWRGRLTTEVSQPLVATGQLSLLALVSGFAGSGLSMPWLYERVKEARRRREEDDAPPRRGL